MVEIQLRYLLMRKDTLTENVLDVSVFKIYMIDWKEKVNDEEVHCPKCGCTESADKMWTQEQVAGMKEIIASWALNHITNELGKSFRSLENSTKGNRHFQIKYKPGKKITFSNNPIGQRDEWELEFLALNAVLNIVQLALHIFALVVDTIL